VAIYDAPATLFVNQFVGTANLVPVEVLRVAGDAVVVGLAGAEILAPGVADASIVAGTQALWAIRPERLRFAAHASSRGIPAQVRVAMPMGPLTVYEVESGAARIKVTEAREAATRLLRPGDNVRIEPADEHAGRIFPAA
jgi:putative spermidine/putrescine transport system ATP-binding protein